VPGLQYAWSAVGWLEVEGLRSDHLPALVQITLGLADRVAAVRPHPKLGHSPVSLIFCGPFRKAGMLPPGRGRIGC
jgi:hypothetical protein